jgi:hypothetical protein
VAGVQKATIWRSAPVPGRSNVADQADVGKPGAPCQPSDAVGGDGRTPGLD